MKWFRKKRRYDEVAPDEVFLDTKNLPNFNTQQFEGVLERPIAKNSFLFLGFFFLVVGIAFVARLGILQVAQGQAYFEQSEENRLHQITIFSSRGVLYDRNGVELAWNVPGENDEPFSYRNYIKEPGFGHVLGFVRYPKKDSAGFFWRLDLEGADGAEKIFDDVLQGENGLRLVETDARLNVQSESQILKPQDGQNVTLTIDAGVQTALHAAMQDMVRDFSYAGGAAMVIDVENGDIIALTNAPEFDPQILSLGQDSEKITNYFEGESKPFLDRVVSGLYTPGSIVKPFIALGMLNEGVITPNSMVTSTGRLEIPNRYNPDNPSVFRDWRPKGHGSTDVYHAIADSVNTFFYIYGGGYQNTDGLGIVKINEYLKKFQLAEPYSISLGNSPRGVIPNPDWKKEVFGDGTWRVGDTYNTVIGQFGTQVTPLQMIRAVSALANGGTLVRPRLTLDEKIESESILGINTAHYDVIHDAMRQTVTEGTAQSLNVSYVQVAAKTGTAQTRGNTRVNAWSIGFFPYDDPKYAFTIVMEEGPSQDNVGSSYAIRKMLDWMNENAPEYFQ